MSAEPANESEESAPEHDHSALSKYRNFLPSEVQQEIWSSEFLLFVEGLSVSFDGFKAVDIPHFGIRHGELRVIIGPNGAGKTTFCDLVSGKTAASTGKVYYDGKNITQMDESDIALMGIGRKFQTPTVFDSLSTYENLLLALPGNQHWQDNLLKRESGDEKNKIFEILEKVNLSDCRDMPAKSLSHGQRQWLAISALIISKPKLLLVDEPAAGLTDQETERTADLLMELAEDHTLVVIEHDMDFVRRLGQKVTVLNEGRVLAEGSLDEMETNEEVMEAYLGR
ncbi:MAG: urea ABC transporter ATP-binding protein UrtD [Opitutae bacterium]|nr:urea ABC transporter ATP-binding protein UrtD [Opitutae bacterium]|tara:strand:+ start:717 stop:1565 length:849 start_codon:yes stop_codon:yes gene_type:complete